jgi:AMMECR1 domain-containing protein
MNRNVGLSIAVAACAAWMPMRARADASELDAYRRLVRSPEARALLASARDAMENAGGEGAEIANEADTLAWPAAPAGVYVTLVKGTATRACVGSPTPPRGTLAASVRSIAALAMTADPRRPPVRRDELADARIVISFTSAGDRVASPFEIDPGRDGLLIGGARGSIAFLPGEARTVQWALREARRVGIGVAGDAVAYRRLEVVTLSEPRPHRRRDDGMP